MTYISVKTIKGKQYAYEQTGVRDGDKVKIKSKYIGPVSGGGGGGGAAKKLDAPIYNMGRMGIVAKINPDAKELKKDFEKEGFDFVNDVDFGKKTYSVADKSKFGGFSDAVVVGKQEAVAYLASTKTSKSGFIVTDSKALSAMESHVEKLYISRKRRAPKNWHKVIVDDMQKNAPKILNNLNIRMYDDKTGQKIKL